MEAHTAKAVTSHSAPATQATSLRARGSLSPKDSGTSVLYTDLENQGFHGTGDVTNCKV